MSAPTSHQTSAPDATPVLSVSGLAAGYGDTQILWDVSLEVRRGEVVAIVGANGAGKSTLLNAISGLLPTWHGSVSLAGRDVTNKPAERLAALGLSQVPQGRRLFVGLSVEQNLRLGAYTRRAGGLEATNAELDRVFTLLPKLRERRTQLAGSLSGGEQQMVAIGRGLMSHPNILLVDELSLGLAPNVVDDLLAAIDTIHRDEGLSFLLVEQDVQIALERSDRGYVVENGHIVLSGTGAELLNSVAVREAYLGA
jgi:branched-chain amino acid transport system ATP-binding protein